jgi:predicted amidohydrolase
VRAGAVQLNSTGGVDRNLETADRLVRDAAGRGAELVVLPEKWNLLASGEEMAAGVQSLDGPAITWATATAAELGIDLVAGSIVARGPDEAMKPSNTSLHVDREGAIRAVYRKLHMFDVEVDGVTYAESDHEQPGDQVVVS